MVIETEERDVRHPDGKIVLKNGNVLDCYPKENRPETIVPDTVGPDRSGEFLQVKGGPKKKLRKPAQEPWRKLFFKEAFFLYEHKERILADSRMFLTPLPFENNLAYTGTSGLRKATLGVYLEWWEECERAVIKKDGEVLALTYFIAGSPLSGSNHCSTVNRKGKCRTVQFASPFSDLWSSFMRINQRYTEAKQIYQAYTLEETLSKLREG
jgi:hypothetical protein